MINVKRVVQEKVLWEVDGKVYWKVQREVREEVWEKVNSTIGTWITP